MLRLSFRPLAPRLRGVRALGTWNGHLSLSSEVRDALHSGAPVVALESTIITHGMPYPTNLETAHSLESILRDEGCVPATIGLIGGKIVVGLSGQQLEHLATSKNAVKVSRRDIHPALALSRDGGTTVAGTMAIAKSVGIDSFVTGGIGGVHRGAESSMDVSADLTELGRTAMLVVCAGAKSILDIPRTLEVLETEGVCVAAFGQKEFPAFYTPRSGCSVPWPVDNVADAAKLAHTGLSLPAPGPMSTLLAVPIPAEYEGEGKVVQEAVEQAVAESKKEGVAGKEVTPWLLKRVAELTGGHGLRLNVKLIENNARVGGKVAAEVARLRRTQPASSSFQPKYARASAARASADITEEDVSGDGHGWGGDGPHPLDSSGQKTMQSKTPSSSSAAPADITEEDVTGDGHGWGSDGPHPPGSKR